jgi:hypothetical protein
MIGRSGYTGHFTGTIRDALFQDRLTGYLMECIADPSTNML